MRDAPFGRPTGKVRSRVRDEVLRYREKLGMTHLIARTQVPGADLDERLAALDALAALDLST